MTFFSSPKLLAGAALSLLVGLSGCSDEQLNSLLQQALDNQTVAGTTDNQSITTADDNASSGVNLTCSGRPDDGRATGRTVLHEGEDRERGEDHGDDDGSSHEQEGPRGPRPEVSDSNDGSNETEPPPPPPQTGDASDSDSHDSGAGPHDPAHDPGSEGSHLNDGSGAGCGPEALASVTGASRSHHFGEDCMACHTAGSGSEAGEHAFTIAGSIYRNGSALLDSEATVSFYTESYGRGTHVLTLPVDAEGNFFTNQSIPELSQGLYPQVEHQGWTTSMVSQPTTTGSCASCHASTTAQGPIYAQ